MSGYVWENANSSSVDIEDNKDKEDGICRIYVDPDIKKTIVLDEMSVPAMSPLGVSSDQYNIKDSAGFIYPIICINNTFLSAEEIDYLDITSSSLLPTISLHITPKTKTFVNNEVIKDGDIISVFIRTSTDIITPIRIDFLIKSSKVLGYDINSQGEDVSIILNGEMYIPGMYSSKDNLYLTGSSKNALKEIAKKLGIGFAFNDECETNDAQLWFSSKERMDIFINNITRHIWKDEQSFFKVWIDFYYNLNFINVNKSLMSEDDIDVTIETFVKTMQDISPIENTEENAIAGLKLLTNYEVKKRSPFYILDFNMRNNSSNITNNIGSNIVNQMFIHNQNYYNQGDSPYIELKNVQMYDPKKKDKTVILRGRNKYNSETAMNYDMQYESVDIEESNTVTQWRGIQYTISDGDVDGSTNNWSGNVNINYNRAETHNLINNAELDKMYISVTVNGPCLQIMRGEKIPIIIVTKDMLDQFTTNNESLKGINKFYSGFYFVDAIKITYTNDNDGDLSNNFNTTFTLKRREWPIPVDYAKDN